MKKTVWLTMPTLISPLEHSGVIYIGAKVEAFIGYDNTGGIEGRRGGRGDGCARFLVY